MRMGESHAIVDGTELRNLRKKLGKKLEEVSSIVGCSAAHMSRIENNISANLSHTLIANLSKYYEIPLSSLKIGSAEESGYTSSFDLIKQIWKSKDILIDNEVIEMNNVLKEALEIAIRKEILWSKENKKMKGEISNEIP